MAKPKAKAAEQVAEVTVEAAEQVAEAKAGQIRVRVVRPVEGKKVGDEFYCYPHEYKLQIKHKSIEVIG